MASKPSFSKLSSGTSPRKYKHQLTSSTGPTSTSIPTNAMQLPLSSSLYVRTPPQQQQQPRQQQQHSPPSPTHRAFPYQSTNVQSSTLQPSVPPPPRVPLAVSSSLLMSTRPALQQSFSPTVPPPSSSLDVVLDDNNAPTVPDVGTHLDDDPYAIGTRVFCVPSLGVVPLPPNAVVGNQHHLNDRPAFATAALPASVKRGGDQHHTPPTSVQQQQQQQQQHNSAPPQHRQLSLSVPRVVRPPSKTLSLGRTLELYSNYSRLERQILSKEVSKSAVVGGTQQAAVVVQHVRDMYEFWPEPTESSSFPSSSNDVPPADAAAPIAASPTGSTRYRRFSGNDEDDGGKVGGEDDGGEREENVRKRVVVASDKNDVLKAPGVVSNIWLTSSEIMLARGTKLHLSLQSASSDLPSKLDSLLKMNTLSWLKHRGKGTKMATEMDRVRMLRDWFEALDVDGSGDTLKDEWGSYSYLDCAGDCVEVTDYSSASS